MTKIIDSLLFRLKKSKLFWIMLGVAFLLPLLTALMNSAMLEIVDVPVTAINAFSLMSESAAPYGDGALLTIIVMSVFLGKEFSGGTMRNTLLSAKTRAQMFFAFAVIGGIISFSYAAAGVGGNMLFGGLIFGFADMAAGEVVTSAFYVLAISLLSALVIVSITFLFLFGTRKLVLVIIMPLIICLFIPSFVLGIIAGFDAVSQVTGVSISTAAIEWIPIVQFYTFDGASIDGALTLKIILMSLLVTGLCGGGGYLAFCKADLK